LKWWKKEQTPDPKTDEKKLITFLSHSNEKGLTDEGQPFDFLVELRGIEPLTPRLPAGKGRKSQSLIYRLVSRFR
jgi:hypothetical protein